MNAWLANKMNQGGLILIISGLVIGALGGFGLTRLRGPLLPWQPRDGISLIELGISKLDKNFEPAGEQPWERAMDRLTCWFGLLIGIVLIGTGLWYGQK